MANTILLNNTDNGVTLNIIKADNKMEIYINPDLGSVTGFVKVYETINFSSVTTNAMLDISGYLRAFKEANPNATSVYMAICMSNFIGNGQFQYSIAGNNISLPTQNPNLSNWSGQMNSYVVNIF
ncbi:hypothetical protein ACLI1A_19415 [Flavobacterium sp. RHBU_3]|uniref:hypothetical protein n=1 Tax=Flavobacterium sp. RHBU_3 TaxID=3391184 RepID=UPI003984D50C